MDKKRPSTDWILAAENELKNLHETLARLDDQGRHDYSLQNRINELQASLESAKRFTYGEGQ